MTQTQIYFDDSFKDHVSSLDYPERTDRVKNIIDLINNEEFKNISIIKILEKSKITFLLPM